MKCLNVLHQKIASILFFKRTNDRMPHKVFDISHGQFFVLKENVNYKIIFLFSEQFNLQSRDLYQKTEKFFFYFIQSKIFYLTDCFCIYCVIALLYAEKG